LRGSSIELFHVQKTSMLPTAAARCSGVSPSLFSILRSVPVFKTMVKSRGFKDLRLGVQGEECRAFMVGAGVSTDQLFYGVVL